MTRHEAIGVLLPKGASYETSDALRAVLLERAKEVQQFPAGHRPTHIFAAGLVLGTKRASEAAWMTSTTSYWVAYANPKPINKDLADGEQRATITVESRDRQSVERVHHIGEPDDGEGKGAWLANALAEQRRPSTQPKPVPESEWRYVEADLAETEHGVIWRDQHGTMHVVFDHRSEDSPHFRIRALLPGGLILEECVAPDA